MQLQVLKKIIQSKTHQKVDQLALPKVNSMMKSICIGHWTYVCNFMSVQFHEDFNTITGKSLSEALILGSTNPHLAKDCSLIYQFNT